MSKEIKLFMAYAPEDEDYQKELSKHLAGLKEDGVISEISAAEVLPGADIMDDLRKRMGQSDIIALLLSADFLGTNHGVELEEMAFAQMAKKGTRLVPIKIREVILGKAYAQFSMLPGQNKPVDDPEWGGRDAAYANITGGIRQLAESMKEDDQPPVRKVVNKPDRPAPSPNPAPDSKMGMKIGIGVVAALAIAAAVWFLMPDKSTGTDTNANNTEKVAPDGNADPVTNPETNPDTNPNADRDAYASAKAENTIEAFEGYLEEIGEGGAYVLEAESNIARLKVAINKAAAEAQWALAVDDDDLVGYKYYIQKYPLGDSVDVATVRIQELSTTADDTKDWETAQNTNTKSSFLLYIQERGDKGLHYDKAISGIKGLLTSSGWSYYGAKKSDDTMQDSRYFDRLLGEKNAKPKAGDLIIVKKAIRVRSGANNGSGVITVIDSESIAEITKVNDDYWVQIMY